MRKECGNVTDLCGNIIQDAEMSFSAFVYSTFHLICLFASFQDKTSSKIGNYKRSCRANVGREWADAGVGGENDIVKQKLLRFDF